MASGNIRKPVKEYTLPYKIVTGQKIINFNGGTTQTLFTVSEVATLVGKSSISTQQTFIYGVNADYESSPSSFIGISTNSSNYYAHVSSARNNVRITYLIVTYA